LIFINSNKINYLGESDMNLKTTVISSFASFLLGSTIFERIKAVILRQDGKELTGAEKRHAALMEIKEIGIDIAGWLINLGIELAVAWLRTKSNAQESK
jgi:hypothetical protein